MLAERFARAWEDLREPENLYINYGDDSCGGELRMPRPAAVLLWLALGHVLFGPLREIELRTFRLRRTRDAVIVQSRDGRPCDELTLTVPESRRLWLSLAVVIARIEARELA